MLKLKGGSLTEIKPQKNSKICESHFFDDTRTSISTTQLILQSNREKRRNNKTKSKHLLVSSEVKKSKNVPQFHFPP
jgi:hypothetical protein